MHMPLIDISCNERDRLAVSRPSCIQQGAWTGSSDSSGRDRVMAWLLLGTRLSHPEIDSPKLHLYIGTTGEPDRVGVSVGSFSTDMTIP